jgi:KUP system potassium uptake protein
VPGAAIFLTRTANDVPPVMVWHVKHNEALHRRVLVVTIVTLSIPWVDDAKRLTLAELAPDFWRATATYGFMERPNVRQLLEIARGKGCDMPHEGLTYYVGRETVVSREDGKGHPAWETAIFTAMARNCAHVSDVLSLPEDCLVEIGRQVAI